MPHMPATGVSGIDLYAITQGGNWYGRPAGINSAIQLNIVFQTLKLIRNLKEGIASSGFFFHYITQ